MCSGKPVVQLMYEKLDLLLVDSVNWQYSLVWTSSECLIR